MDCPNCKTPMIILELSGIEIDYCYNCFGIWLDEGELELLLKEAKRKDNLLSSFRKVPNAGEKKKKCPVCLKKMEKIDVGTREKVLIERCKNKHGLWFDRGELNQVIKLGQIDENNEVLDFLEEMFKVNDDKSTN